MNKTELENEVKRLNELNAEQAETISSLEGDADAALQEKAAKLAEENKLLKEENELLKQTAEEQQEHIKSLDAQESAVASANPVVKHDGKKIEVLLGRMRFEGAWLTREQIVKSPKALDFLIEKESPGIKIHK